MKRLKYLLLLLSIAFGFPGLLSFKTSEKNISRNNATVGSQVLLEYVGTMSGVINLSVGIQVAIDTTIGVRYEVTLEQGGSLLSHIAIFYKFSNPYQSVAYDFLTHKSNVINGGSPNSDPNVDVIGKETVDTFLCTHLRQGDASKGVNNYWMSPKVPGFLQLINALKNISPGLPAIAFDGTIFKWGGIVKMTHYYVDKKTGQANNLDLHLHDANSEIELPSNTFDVPSK